MKPIKRLTSRTPIIALSLLMACFILSLASCTEKRFHIKGNITGAADSTLVFEQMALDGLRFVDSVTLDADGAFDFQGERSEAPEFYRLSIAGESINLSVDSTETITVKATYPGMATNYKVSGSENCTKIQELTLMQLKLEQQANAVMQSPALGVIATEDSINVIIGEYKQKVMRDYIFREPMKAYAYFALFQTLNVGSATIPIFNPQYDINDVKVFGAVANTWDTYYPHSLRTENLHNITIERMKDANVKKRRANEVVIDAENLEEASLIDLRLTDNKGQQRTLNQLKGKVVLLDFHAFSNQDSPKRIMQLRSLYDKYHAQGLEIYQVSLDKDLHFWKTQTAALPWICVHDDGSRSQAYLAVVPSLPADFIIGRDNTILKGPQDIKDLEQAVASVIR